MGPEYGRSTGPQISGGPGTSERSVMTEMPEVSERAGIATRNVYRAVHIKKLQCLAGYRVCMWLVAMCNAHTWAASCNPGQRAAMHKSQ